MSRVTPDASHISVDDFDTTDRNENTGDAERTGGAAGHASPHLRAPPRDTTTACVLHFGISLTRHTVYDSHTSHDTNTATHIAAKEGNSRAYALPHVESLATHGAR
jgi:hypothetical protein